MWGPWALTQLPVLLLATLAQPLTTAATTLQPAITPTEEQMQAISPMETRDIAQRWDNLYTEWLQLYGATQSTTQTSVYMHVCIVLHQLLQPSGWADT